MINKKIGFIGSGNMAYSLIAGLLATGVKGQNIWLSDPDIEKTDAIAQRFSTNTAKDNNALVQSVDVVVLAIKPQQLALVCDDIQTDVKDKKSLVISIAAGILSADIDRWLGSENSNSIVRCMPNTPAQVQSGASVLFANSQVSEEERALSESIMRAVGLTLWVEDEQQMHAVTALSGSGPAYIFLVIEALEKAGVELGLDNKSAQLLAIQTTFGAAKMALESDESPEVLRKKVTSPGGTTEKAIEILQAGQIEKLFYSALEGAKDRSIELAKILGENS